MTLLLSTTASYALSRMRFRGRRQMPTGLLLMQMFPAVLALVAIYAIFDRPGAVFPAIGLGLPITVIFLLAQRWMIAGLAAGGVKG